MDEQFVQDAISNKKRLQRIIHGLGMSDWEAMESDLLNQEFNFSATDATGSRSGGRIDVIATFNDRTRLVIVEVKLVASETDLEQLFWYYDHREELSKVDESILGSVDFDKTIAILLAKDFLPGEYETGDRNIHLVRFHFNGKEFPFETPTDVKKLKLDNAAPILKHSHLNTIEEHRNYLNEGLRDEFDELRRCCLKADDPRTNWIFENPKGEHVAIHYKGEYVVYFFVRRKWFYIGYSVPGCEPVHEKIDLSENRFEILKRARSELATILDSIDSQDGMSGIPPGFDWSLVENENHNCDSN